jgi:uncharacterized protein
MQPDVRWLVVSVHDAAPSTWARCERVIDAIAAVADIPLTFLVVPAYHGSCSAQPEFERHMGRLVRRGHELALHGYFHRDSQLPGGWADWLKRRVYTAGEGEFAALPEREAAERLYLGRRWFTANGWPLAGFVPPAWLMGAGAWRALRCDGHFEYATTLGRIHLLRQGTSVRAPAFTYSTRSALRRGLSVAWNTALPAALGRARVVRLALHPDDADHPRIRSSWQRLLERLLQQRRAVTKAGLVRALGGAAVLAPSPRAMGTGTARPSTIA